MKKDFYKATEKYLYSYPRMKKSIANLKTQLNNVTPAGPGGVSFGGVGEHNHISNPTENEALDIIKTKEVLSDQIIKTEEKIRMIDSCLDSLTKIEKSIITNYYFKQRKLYEIGNANGYSVRQISRIKRKTIEKLKCSLFGDTIA